MPAVVAVMLLVAAVVPTAGSAASEGGRAQSDTDPQADGDPQLPADAQESDGEGSRRTEALQPGGLVAYVTSDARVWLGSGNQAPVVVGSNAAIGANGQSAVAVSPTGDGVAYVRADGALVLSEPDGSAEWVLRTDAALDVVGMAPVLSWDGTGKTLAYVAVGTDADVEEKATQPRSGTSGSFLAPLPAGPLGNVVRIVDVQGDLMSTSGDPSLRDAFGVATSLTDPVLVVQTRIPGTEDRYTLALAGGGAELAPTPFSADDPDFSPDGAFLVTTGPAKGQRELQRVDLSDLSTVAIARDDTICAPVVSPDSTRIAYGSGPDCSHLSVVSSLGGPAFDITPAESPDTASFGVAALGWSSDGRFVTFPRCTGTGAELSCDGTSWFLEPDTGRLLEGPEAVTVSPIRRALIQDIFLDFQMRGPIEASASFPISAETEGALTDVADTDLLEADITNGTAALSVQLTAAPNGFVTGTLTLDDPEAGVDRTFSVVARISLLGLRIVSLSGIWMSTSDMPFATGEFNMAIRRR